MTKEEQNLNQTEKVNLLYDKYSKYFPKSFLHNMFWKLLVDKTRKLTNAAFTPVIKKDYIELGISDKEQSGYSPTGIIFEKRNYDEAQQICTEMNADVFGITEEQADEIVFSALC